jgi:hypothetical protein
VVVGGGPIAGSTARSMQEFVEEKLKTLPNADEFLPLTKVSVVKSDDHIHNYYDYVISQRYAKLIKKIT